MIDTLPVYKEGNLTHLQCPQCGERLFEERGLVWCSGVARKRGQSCDYGVANDITKAEHRRRVTKTENNAKLLDPDGTGFWIFEGIRYTASRRFLVSIRDLVEIRKREGSFEVVMLGCSTHFNVEAFEGTWERVVINFGGERK